MTISKSLISSPRVYHNFTYHGGRSFGFMPKGSDGISSCSGAMIGNVCIASCPRGLVDCECQGRVRSTLLRCPRSGPILGIIVRDTDYCMLVFSRLTDYHRVLSNVKRYPGPGRVTAQQLVKLRPHIVIVKSLLKIRILTQSRVSG